MKTNKWYNWFSSLSCYAPQKTKPKHYFGDLILRKIGEILLRKIGDFKFAIYICFGFSPKQ